jgi:hypothetical protein
MEEVASRLRSTHYVIISFVARWTSGEACLSDEADAVDWIDPTPGPRSPTTPGLPTRRSLNPGIH